MKAVLCAVAALLAAPLASATVIEVSYSEEFAETLEEDYGEREGVFLIGKIQDHLDFELDKAGLDPERIEVTINNAKPNRPTFKQLGDQPGLDYMRSISIGGMDLSATIFDAAGNEIAAVQYDWFESDIRQVAPAGTWSDARRASRRFAREVVEALSESGQTDAGS